MKESAMTTRSNDYGTAHDPLQKLDVESFKVDDWYDGPLTGTCVIAGQTHRYEVCECPGKEDWHLIVFDGDTAIGWF